MERVEHDLEARGDRIGGGLLEHLEAGLAHGRRVLSERVDDRVPRHRVVPSELPQALRARGTRRPILQRLGDVAPEADVPHAALGQPNVVLGRQAVQRPRVDVDAAAHAALELEAALVPGALALADSEPVLERSLQVAPRVVGRVLILLGFIPVPRVLPVALR